MYVRWSSCKEEKQKAEKKTHQLHCKSKRKLTSGFLAFQAWTKKHWHKDFSIEWYIEFDLCALRCESTTHLIWLINIVYTRAVQELISRIPRVQAKHVRSPWLQVCAETLETGKSKCCHTLKKHERSFQLLHKVQRRLYSVCKFVFPPKNFSSQLQFWCGLCVKADFPEFPEWKFRWLNLEISRKQDVKFQAWSKFWMQILSSVWFTEIRFHYSNWIHFDKQLYPKASRGAYHDSKYLFYDVDCRCVQYIRSSTLLYLKKRCVADCHELCPTEVLIWKKVTWNFQFSIVKFDVNANDQTLWRSGGSCALHIADISHSGLMMTVTPIWNHSERKRFVQCSTSAFPSTSSTANNKIIIFAVVFHANKADHLFRGVVEIEIIPMRWAPLYTMHTHIGVGRCSANGKCSKYQVSDCLLEIRLYSARHWSQCNAINPKLSHALVSHQQWFCFLSASISRSLLTFYSCFLSKE